MGKSEIQKVSYLLMRSLKLQAYKRVGRMVHSADYGRGVVGVMDITELMVSADCHAIFIAFSITRTSMNNKYKQP